METRQFQHAPFSWGFSHPWMPMAFYLPLGFGLGLFSHYIQPRPLNSILLWVLSGVLLWTLLEYFLHRFAFHSLTLKEPWRGLVAEAHLEHHRTAHTGEGILVRPFFGFSLAVLIYFLLAALTWGFSLPSLLLPGIFLGYLAYEWVHFGAHRFAWNSGLGKFMKSYHLHHHFKDPSRAFGVTSPFWDWVFGTRPV